MNSERLAAVALASYPPSFKARYGVELRGLVEEDTVDHRVVADLALGAARAWLRPSFDGDPLERRRRRLQATVATTWVACCAGAMAVPGLNRALLDPPPPHVDPMVRHLLEGAQLPLAVAGLLLLAAGLLAGLPTARGALSNRDRRILGPIVPAVVLSAVEGAGLLAVWLLRRGHPAMWPHPSVAFVIVGLSWVLGFGGLVIAAAIGPAVALTRSTPTARQLTKATWASAAAAIVLASAVVLCVIAVGLNGVGIYGATGSLVGLAACVVAVTAAGRGLRAAVLTPVT
jgi:hypothetical protein